MLLESFIADRWQSGRGAPASLVDASTGAPVAQAPALAFPAGIDPRQVLEHARSVGGPALRRLTFHERALRLKALAQYLTGRKEELYALSYATGATRRDAGLDIDGGIGTLFVYASKAMRELPDARVFAEGAVEPLSKSGSFVGQHILVPLEGAAIHINAFNFPVWGMLEKLAPTFIAGVAAIVKPATSTSYLTALAFRLLLESGVLPPGAVQLLIGGVEGLFDDLQCQDSVAFTGSASTAQRLRSHPAIHRHSVRFTAETDSLNASILAPDASPDTPEFDAFIEEVCREMIVKAGQKCTAIRKAIVPAAIRPRVLEALRARLEKIVVGDPRRETVQMGPLASLAQRQEVHTQLGRLLAATQIITGREQALRPAAADARQGAFIAPTLLDCVDARATSAAVIDEVEAFGPVCTVLAYATLEEAVGLARRGGGSLVSSVFSADPHIAAQLTLGLAPYHGRVLVVDRTCRNDSTGHGSPLPHLVHGGPGRAGGGEELGGIRAVTHYMQRTAVQGSPELVSTVTGRWVRGAPRLTGGHHPFRKAFGELNIGDAFDSAEREITLGDIERFADLSGDHFYAHMDEAAARGNPLFGGRVAHGYFLISAAAGLFVDPDPGPVLANYGLDSLRFVKPVKPGERIRVRLTCKEKSLRAGMGYGEVRWAAEITNQLGETVAAYDVLTMVSEQVAG